MIKRNFDNLFKEELQKIENSKPTLLLHVCCAPCSCNVIKELDEFFNITIYFSNANIFPEDEYDRRKDELIKFINQHHLHINIIEDIQNPMEFLSNIRIYQDEPEGGKRCFLCYKLRMNRTYRYASKNNFDYWTTVLSVSKYKNSQWINEIGESFEQSKTKFLYSDFKKNNGYQKSYELSNTYEMYRQTYCGCLFSYIAMKNRVKS